MLGRWVSKMSVNCRLTDLKRLIRLPLSWIDMKL
jgi:hypothetical protein